MKKYLTYTLILMSVLLFTACPSDDDEDTPNIESQFIGYWTIPNIYERTNGTREIYNVLNMMLFENGTLKYFIGNKYSTPIEGHWSYNKNTNTLVTDIQLDNRNLQWEITASSDNRWSGLSLWNDKNLANTAQQGNSDELACIILHNLKWRNNDSSSPITNLKMKETSLPRLYPNYNIHWIDEWNLEHNTSWGILRGLDGQNFSYTSTISTDKKTLLLNDATTGAYVKVFNPFCGIPNKMEMKVFFPNMIIDYIIPGHQTSTGFAHSPIWGSFEGEFSMQ